MKPVIFALGLVSIAATNPAPLDESLVAELNQTLVGEEALIIEYQEDPMNAGVDASWLDALWPFALKDTATQ